MQELGGGGGGGGGGGKGAPSLLASRGQISHVCLTCCCCVLHLEPSAPHELLTSSSQISCMCLTHCYCTYAPPRTFRPLAGLSVPMPLYSAVDLLSMCQVYYICMYCILWGISHSFDAQISLAKRGVQLMH